MFVLLGLFFVRTTEVVMVNDGHRTPEGATKLLRDCGLQPDVVDAHRVMVLKSKLGKTLVSVLVL
jgi:hypothetical protein